MYPETYSIEVSIDDGLSWLLHTDGLQELCHTLDTLHYGIPYYVRVKAHNKFGTSDAKNPLKYIRGNIIIFVSY